MLLIVIFHAYYLTQIILSRQECQTDICICHGSSEQCRCYFHQTPYCDGYGPSQTCSTNHGCLGCDNNSSCIACISEKQFVDLSQNCIDCPEQCLTCIENIYTNHLYNNVLFTIPLYQTVRVAQQIIIIQIMDIVNNVNFLVKNAIHNKIVQLVCLNSFILYLEFVDNVIIHVSHVQINNNVQLVQKIIIILINNNVFHVNPLVQLVQIKPFVQVVFQNQNKNRFNYNGQCMKQCPLNCLSCENSLQCIICEDSYYLNDNYSCVKCKDPCENCLSQDICTTCQITYFKKNQDCILCQQPCVTCLDEFKCSNCVDGYYLQNENCIQCPLNCLKCDQFRCYQCNKQSKLFNDYCIDCLNPINHTLDICNYIDCRDGIWTHGEECDNGNQYGCINCIIQMGYYCNNILGYPSQCQRCIENCIQCKIDRLCQVCKDGYFLNPNNQCQECNIECKTCIYQPNNCLTCKIINQQFQQCHLCEINLGYYTDFLNNQCYSKCGDNIKTVIEQCDDGNNINGDGCSSKCLIEDGFYCIIFKQKKLILQNLQIYFITLILIIINQMRIFIKTVVMVIVIHLFKVKFKQPNNKQI